MATGGGRRRSWRGDNYRHTCSLCMEPYGGRQPKILPCFHTFCLPCLTILTTTAATAPLANSDNNTDNTKENSEEAEKAVEEKSDTEAVQGGGGSGGVDGAVVVVFLCPTCRCPVTIPEGGVANLQTNFYLELDEADVSPRPLPCDMCEEEEAKDATHACDKCQMRMCCACRRLHDKVGDARTHNVRPLGPEDQSSPAAKPEVQKCPMHPDQSLVFHCRKCDVSICLHCKLTSHEGHETEDMFVAVRRAKEDLTKLLAKANEQIQLAGTVLDRLDLEERELARQKQEVTREIGTRYETIIQWASRSRDEVTDSVTSKEHKTLRELRTERTSAKATLETLSELVSRASRLPQFCPSVVLLKAELQSALLSDDSLDKLNNRTTAEVDKLKFFPCQSDTSTMELEMMQAYMGRLREADVGSAKDSSVLSVRGLSARVDDLTGKLAEHATHLASENAGLRAKLADLTTIMATLTSKTKETGKKLSKLGDKMNSITETTNQMVAFHAGLESKRKSDSRIIFDDIVYNEGNRYDSSTGVFTTPASGLYVFFLVIGASSEENVVKGYIQHEGRQYGFARTESVSQSCTQVVLKLDAGEKVWAGTTSHSSYLCQHECFFSGALIQAKI